MSETTTETYDEPAEDSGVKVPNVHQHAVSGISHQALGDDDSRALDAAEPETADHATSGDPDADPDDVEVIPGETADHPAQDEDDVEGEDEDEDDEGEDEGAPAVIGDPGQEPPQEPPSAPLEPRQGDPGTLPQAPAADPADGSQEHPGTGEPSEGVEQPADGTMSQQLIGEHRAE